MPLIWHPVQDFFGDFPIFPYRARGFEHRQDRRPIFFPPADIETEVVGYEAGIDVDTARILVTLAGRIRNLDGSPLREVASTRMLILAGGLVAEGLSLRSAVQAAMVQVLSDDGDLVRALGELVDATLPQT